MERTIENGFELTGPIARGDWETVERHRAALARQPSSSRSTTRSRRRRGRDRRRSRSRELDLPRHGVVGLVPTMGALHAGHDALFAAARAECDVARREPLRQPGAVLATPSDLAAYPRDLERDAASRRGGGVDVLFAPSAAELYPPGFATWVEPGGRRRWASRASTAPATSAASRPSA